MKYCILILLSYHLCFYHLLYCYTCILQETILISNWSQAAYIFHPKPRFSWSLAQWDDDDLCFYHLSYCYACILQETIFVLLCKLPLSVMYLFPDYKQTKPSLIACAASKLIFSAGIRFYIYNDNHSVVCVCVCGQMVFPNDSFPYMNLG